MANAIIDEWATKIPIESGLPPCLYVPIAAKDPQAIERHVGTIECEVKSSSVTRVLVVKSHTPMERDQSLSIWTHENCGVLHAARQVWVNVDYGKYRKAYRAAFSDQDITGMYIDHVLNRRVARLKGFTYVRVVAISPEANSSSGGLCEKWQVEYHSTPQMRELNAKSQATVQYADLADVVKMLDMKTGHSLQSGVNQAQALVRRRGNSAGDETSDRS
ncbi:MAG: hypothetical protein ACJ8C4_15590 [Gemmataceae bacterium]